MSNIEKGLNSLATTINVLLEEDVELPASYKVTLSNILEEVIDMISDLDKLSLIHISEPTRPY